MLTATMTEVARVPSGTGFDLEEFVSDAIVGDGMHWATAVEHDTPDIARIMVSPAASHWLQLAQHVDRYQRAIQRLDVGPRDRVLDVWCGQGGGSYLLAQHAESVIGLEVNERHLSAAREQFHSGGLTFESYDDYMSSRRKPVDKLVCIETLESIAADALPGFLDRLLSRLMPGGEAFISCALGADRPNPRQPLHVNEPSLETLRRCLMGRFGRSEFEVRAQPQERGRSSDGCWMTLRDYQPRSRPAACGGSRIR